MRQRLYLLWIACAGSILCIIAACGHSGSNVEDQIPDIVSYNFNIRPILSDKCYKCHGPDASKRQAGLRLDMPESAFKALKDNPNAHVLVPGSPEMSELFRRISTNDTSEMMPPAASNLKRLTPHEVDLIKKWIKQGAKFEKHWAFVPPKSSPVPEVKDKEWPKNPIDNFILHKQEQYGLKPNPEADKERLLKRICLDLTGLPPDLATMDRFLADNSPNAYEKAVDALM
jgi:hypothetical protein